MKRPYSIKTWLVGGIIALVAVPYASTFLLVLLTGLFEPPEVNAPVTVRDPAAMEALYHGVESAHARWMDPDWQREVRSRLETLQVGLILTPAGAPRQHLNPSEPDMSLNLGFARYTHRVVGAELRRVAVYDSGEFRGDAQWFDQRVGNLSPARASFHQFQTVFMYTSIPLVILGTIWAAVRLLSKAILSPLDALSAAARRINAGELGFSVPASSIAEINEFARAFDQMRAGLKESIARQASAEQERRLLVAAVAHDLRTPLSSVRGYLEGLRDGVAKTPEKVDRYVTVALEKTGRLERLIEDLFAFSRTEYLNQLPQREQLDLGALLKTAAEALSHRAEASGIAVHLADPGTPCPVEADPLMLERIADNLLDNALRYTPSGGAVTVGWSKEDGRATFWVQDTGPGVAVADMQRIFEPLYRADKARSTRTGGAGLGLATASRLAEAHEGAISVTNQQGARFTVSFPTP